MVSCPHSLTTRSPPKVCPEEATKCLFHTSVPIKATSSEYPDCTKEPYEREGQRSCPLRRFTRPHVHTMHAELATLDPCLSCHCRDHNEPEVKSHTSDTFHPIIISVGHLRGIYLMRNRHMHRAAVVSFLPKSGGVQRYKVSLSEELKFLGIQFLAGSVSECNSTQGAHTAARGGPR